MPTHLIRNFTDAGRVTKINFCTAALLGTACTLQSETLISKTAAWAFIQVHSRWPLSTLNYSLPFHFHSRHVLLLQQKTMDWPVPLVVTKKQI